MKQCARCLLMLTKTTLLMALCGLAGCAPRCPIYQGRCPSWLALFSKRCPCPQPLPTQRIVISVEEQTMVTFEDSRPKKRYAVSTSRFGVGDKLHSCLTPLGHLEVTEIIGDGLPKGALLRGRQPTGEILRPNTPGYDAIVTRILRLRGTEPRNARAMQRCIYIHGTTAEKCLKTAVSWGCIRMGSRDIIHLCRWVKPGTRVDIVPGKLPPPEMLPP
ncbi:L,D-transpeptidase family protein [Prosthecobacter sp.]|uniref:L,D-transpeptidase family protein n=1 Tax=Prosthecobacter sp. TaxID=1965333 RepID=UPI003784AF9D